MEISRFKAILGLLVLLAVTRIEAAPTCEPTQVDGVWQSINPYSVIDDASTYSTINYPEKVAITKLGRPDRIDRGKDGQVFFYWKRGTWRESRSDDCKGHMEKMYTVAYAILKLSFKDGRQTNCEVLERAFVSTNKRPDPFRETKGLMPSSLQSCKDFLAVQTAR